MNKRKHELEQNELVDVFGINLDKLKKNLPRICLVGGGILFCVVAIA